MDVGDSRAWLEKQAERPGARYDGGAVDDCAS